MQTSPVRRPLKRTKATGGGVGVSPMTLKAQPPQKRVYGARKELLFSQSQGLDGMAIQNYFVNSRVGRWLGQTIITGFVYL